MAHVCAILTRLSSRTECHADSRTLLHAAAPGVCKRVYQWVDQLAVSGMPWRNLTLTCEEPYSLQERADAAGLVLRPLRCSAWPDLGPPL